MTESEIKKSYVRYRMCKVFDGRAYNGDSTWISGFQNYKVFDQNQDDKFKCNIDKLDEYEQKFRINNWNKVFDTYKKDY